ncbi:DUF1003 domain-containing protein [Erythrobacter sp. WG]|uniref:DUF1003 domain-containing protein n=1 Tax=Erythrobacter sp. WG TaxID=2985510 RepID=UPI00226FCBF4|nr:DUF1003 domain-containing protein [Erythrobacter sp. WG]MCX9146071.1 DUF1003 domain-containing protein [Erythrobacter sp. WG]
MPAPAGLSGTLRENIVALSEREGEENARAPWSERLARHITAFTGSMVFVWVHVAIVVVWIAVNLGWLPGPRFDPSFVILASAASLEAIFLSTFVLISHNRMAALADRRADLDLHISLLTEHELTRLAELLHRLAERLGVPVDSAELAEIEQDVVAGEVLDEIDQHETRGS